ncbi:MAG: Coenzyme F420 hydrogenase/dehydrogenase, beta subunit C-terminal domain [Tannerellaceae bacterium]
MIKSAIGIIGADKCASCFLCGDVCSKDAIVMKYDEEGFYKPFVNQDLCNNFGACALSCPVLHDEKKIPSFEKPKVFAAWNNDKEIRLKSSSGGIYYAMAQWFLELGGYVCGVKWKNGNVIFDIAHNTEELIPFLGSKYLQADASHIYSQIKNFLSQGKKIMFVGLPCQTQALSNIISNDNLFIVDLVCAGVPSYKIFKKYCDETFPTQSIDKVNFRSKRTGWRKYSIEYFSSNKAVFRNRAISDPFFNGFNTTMYYNKGCYTCKLNTLPRRAHITLCDYWGAKGMLDTREGTSLILINDSIGQEWMDKFLQERGNQLFLIEQTYEAAVLGTKRIHMSSRLMPKERAEIFSLVDSLPFKEICRKYFQPITLKGRVINRIKRVLKSL